MTIDEAIEQFKYDAECNRADLDLSYAEENEQVAEWLEELKDLRELKDTITSNAEVLEMQGYNKAIDEFVKLVKKYDWDIRNRNENAFIYGAIDKIAEQLKAGVLND